MHIVRIVIKKNDIQLINCGSINVVIKSFDIDSNTKGFIHINKENKIIAEWYAMFN